MSLPALAQAIKGLFDDAETKCTGIGKNGKIDMYRAKDALRQAEGLSRAHNDGTNYRNYCNYCKEPTLSCKPLPVNLPLSQNHKPCGMK